MGAAFASAIFRIANFGSVKVAYGSYTSTGGATGGDINTGLGTTMFIKLTPNAAAVAASTPVVNETLPLEGAVTIVTAANQVGYWMAVGW